MNVEASREDASLTGGSLSTEASLFFFQWASESSSSGGRRGGEVRWEGGCQGRGV